jgi:hypothetical protein
MLANGLNAPQVAAVRGFADRDLRMPADPLNAKNRRVSIVVRSQSAVDLERSVRARQTSPEAVAAVAGGMGPDAPIPAEGAVNAGPVTPSLRPAPGH